MIYISRGAFKPLLIIGSVIFIPLTLASIVLTFHDWKIELLAVDAGLIVLYALYVWIVDKDSKSKKRYLLCEDHTMQIIENGREQLSISRDTVVEIQYYRISKLKNWLLLECYTAPQCAAVFYKENGEEKRYFFGYPNLEELRTFCEEKGICLKIV